MKTWAGPCPTRRPITVTSRSTPRPSARSRGSGRPGSSSFSTGSMNCTRRADRVGTALHGQRHPSDRGGLQRGGPCDLLPPRPGALEIREAVVVREDGTVLQSRGARVTDVRATASGLEFDAADESRPGSVADREQPGVEGDRTSISRPAARPVSPEGRRQGSRQGRRDRVGQGSQSAGRARARPGRAAPQGDQRQKPPLLLSLAAAERHVSLRLPQARAGQNAIEVPRFDPLVEEKEREIARLCKPRPIIMS